MFGFGVFRSTLLPTLMNPRNEKTVIFYLLTPGLDEILEEDEGLVDVPPVLAVVVEPLPDHLHDLGEGDHVVGQVYKV